MAYADTTTVVGKRTCRRCANTFPSDRVPERRGAISWH